MSRETRIESGGTLRTGTEVYGGEISVTLVDAQEFAYYTVRTFLVQRARNASGAESPGAAREVHQLQFTAWPDHGVPDHPAPFLLFLRRVRSFYTDDMGPIVVHCR